MTVADVEQVRWLSHILTAAILLGIYGYSRWAATRDSLDFWCDQHSFRVLKSRCLLNLVALPVGGLYALFSDGVTQDAKPIVMVALALVVLRGVHLAFIRISLHDNCLMYISLIKRVSLVVDEQCLLSHASAGRGWQVSRGGTSVLIPSVLAGYEALIRRLADAGATMAR